MLNLLGGLLFAALIFLTITALLVWLVPIALPALGVISFTQGMAMTALLLLVLLLLAAATS